jgi:2-phosphosulfolactate phosphatase
MRVELFFSSHQTDELSLRDKTVVVIDVLRASTTLATGLQSGAKEIIPVTSVERAVKISGSLFGDVILLAGERNGKMIEGFNLGNSPSDFSEEKVKGKTIIFSSTNGSRAIEKARYARDLIIGGFVNMSTVVSFLMGKKSDFTVLCAGNEGMFSLEDAVCAGMIFSKLTEEHSLVLKLSDAALAATMLYKSYSRNLLKMIKNSEHGQYLTEIGFGDDLPTCASVDTIPVLPQLVGNVIKLKRDAEAREPIKVPVPSP